MADKMGREAIFYVGVSSFYWEIPLECIPYWADKEGKLCKEKEKNKGICRKTKHVFYSKNTMIFTLEACKNAMTKKESNLFEEKLHSFS